jgi:hypothetical protein
MFIYIYIYIYVNLHLIEILIYCSAYSYRSQLVALTLFMLQYSSGGKPGVDIAT